MQDQLCKTSSLGRPGIELAGRRENLKSIQPKDLRAERGMERRRGAQRSGHVDGRDNGRVQPFTASNTARLTVFHRCLVDRSFLHTATVLRWLPDRGRTSQGAVIGYGKPRKAHHKHDGEPKCTTHALHKVVSARKSVNVQYFIEERAWSPLMIFPQPAPCRSPVFAQG
jgi:hypothetical protein